jgi:hypothetical protein
MAYFIALGILVLIGIGASVWLIRTDGYGPVPTDPRRLPGGADLHAPREDPAPSPEVGPATPARVRRAQRDAAARA